LVHVDGFDAIETSQKLAVREGIFSGTSGGGILWAALQLAKKSKSGTNILAMIPDTGERYLSTPLFEDIPADMSEDEKALAASTPSNPPPPPGLPDVLPEAQNFVEQTNAEHKIVVWSLVSRRAASNFLSSLSHTF
jgi:cysteine synthase A